MRSRINAARVEEPLRSCRRCKTTSGFIVENDLLLAKPAEKVSGKEYLILFIEGFILELCPIHATYVAKTLGNVYMCLLLVCVLIMLRFRYKVTQRTHKCQGQRSPQASQTQTQPYPQLPPDIQKDLQKLRRTRIKPSSTAVNDNDTFKFQQLSLTDVDPFSTIQVKNEEESND